MGRCAAACDLTQRQHLPPNPVHLCPCAALTAHRLPRREARAQSPGLRRERRRLTVVWREGKHEGMARTFSPTRSGHE